MNMHTCSNKPMSNIACDMRKTRAQKNILNFCMFKSFFVLSFFAHLVDVCFFFFFCIFGAFLKTKCLYFLTFFYKQFPERNKFPEIRYLEKHNHDDRWHREAAGF